MALELTILYRGPLSSCNYDCSYCPFAKRHETAAQLRLDREALWRFVDWIEREDQNTYSIQFTPWGEALTRRWYREAMIRLSHFDHVKKVAIQTNLSWNTDWVSDCDLQHVGFWCTWHPEQVSSRDFLAQCRQLDQRKVRYSVGIVGLKEYLEAAIDLRARLSSDVYLWVNAYKDVENYYDSNDIARWRQIDPLFEINNRRYRSHGRRCRTGHRVISVSGDGTIQRCHFIKTPLGNLYEDDLASLLAPRRCSGDFCGCHIGYVHMEDLQLYSTFGDGLLERIPAKPIWKDAIDGDGAAD